MKKNLLLLLVLFFVTSCNSYYSIAELQDDIPLYSKADSLSRVKTIIPYESKVQVYKKKKGNYTKIKWGKYVGYSYNPDILWYSPSSNTYDDYPTYYKKPYKQNYSNNKYNNSSIYSYKSKGGGSVRVKGYYRKDGTYVRPHTRKAPRTR